MAQIALPLSANKAAARIVQGVANAAVIAALGNPDSWPFATAILSGPPRSGKTLLAQWFADYGLGTVIDDAERWEEEALFHRWNRAQADKRPLLLVVNRAKGEWGIQLPDLASRLAAALHLEIGAPDDAMLAELIALHAEARGLALGEGAAAYLVPRGPRSAQGIEALVSAIDRLSWERKAPPGMALWRAALEEINGVNQPRLL